MDKLKKGLRKEWNAIEKNKICWTHVYIASLAVMFEVGARPTEVMQALTTEGNIRKGEKDNWVITAHATYTKAWKTYDWKIPIENCIVNFDKLADCHTLVKAWGPARPGEGLHLTTWKGKYRSLCRWWIRKALWGDTSKHTMRELRRTAGTEYVKKQFMKFMKDGGNKDNPLNNSSSILFKHYACLQDIIGETIIPPSFP